MGQTQTQTDDANVGYSRSDGVCTYVIIGMYVQLYARVRTLEPTCEIPHTKAQRESPSIFHSPTVSTIEMTTPRVNDTIILYFQSKVPNAQ